MEGWNNPLPIGRSIRDLTLKKQPGLGSGRKKVSPVAGAGRGHSSETRSPQTTHTYSAVRLHEHQITTLPTIRFLQSASYTSRSLSPTRHPFCPHMRPHCHLGILRRQPSPMAGAAATSPKASASGTTRKRN